MRRLVGVVTVASMVILGVVATDVSARAAGSTSVLDANDVGGRLDIRSVSVARPSSQKTRVKIVFWNRVPVWLLRRRAARVEMAVDGSYAYFFRFWPNKKGWLRVTWGDPGSNCCDVSPAAHPDAHTYISSMIPTDGILYPYPTSFRGVTTHKFDPCSGSRCGVGGKQWDRTRWKDL
jgi:hypothetical protein